MRYLLPALALFPVIGWSQAVRPPVTAVAISNDGKFVVAGYADGWVRSFHAGDRTQRWQLKTDSTGGFSRVAFSPDGKSVVVVPNVQGTWRNVRLYSSTDGKLIRSVGVGATAAYSGDGKWLGVGGPGGLVVLDAKTMQVARRFDQVGLVLNVAFNQTGTMMGFTSNGAIQLMMLPDYRPVGSVSLPTFDALQVGFSKEDAIYAAIAKSGRIYRWNLKTREALPVLTSKFQNPVAATISPDGSVGGFVNTANNVEVFDLAKGSALPSPRLGGGYANSLSLGDTAVVMGTLEGQVRWATRPLTTQPIRTAGVAGAVFDAVMKVKPDVMYGTTVLGSPVRVVQVDLKRPSVRVGIEVARGFPTGAESFDALVRRSGAQIAITGTFFDTVSLRPVGDLVHNGSVLYRGHMGTALAFTPDNEPFMRRVPFGRTQDWSAFETVLGCGPALVLDGEVDVDATGEGFRDPSIFGTVPRVGVGFTPDKRLLLVATGPLSFQGFARVMQALQCTHAMNLDAGSSRALYYRGRTLIRPGRQLTNILYVRIN